MSWCSARTVAATGSTFASSVVARRENSILVWSSVE